VGVADGRARGEREWVLLRIDPEGAVEALPFSDDDMPAVYYFRLSPDGRYLAGHREMRESSAWLLEGF
jgi:hypothetical protein